MTHADRDQATFTFPLHGGFDAQVVGKWARAASVPPEFFAELLKSLRIEWMDAGCEPSAATAAGEIALAAYNRSGLDAPNSDEIGARRSSNSCWLA